MNNYFIFNATYIKFAGFGNLYSFIFNFYQISIKYNKICYFYYYGEKQNKLIPIFQKYFNFNDRIRFINSLEQLNFLKYNCIELNNLEQLINNQNYIFSYKKFQNFKFLKLNHNDLFNNDYLKLLKTTFNQEKIEIQNKIKNIQNKIIINIRRGQKLLDRNKRFLILDKVQIFSILDTNSQEKIVFISDDIQWCKDNFSNYKNVQFLENYEIEKEITDFYYLTKCKKIIGNSDCSFTLIASKFNKNKKHIFYSNTSQNVYNSLQNRELKFLYILFDKNIFEKIKNNNDSFLLIKNQDLQSVLNNNFFHEKFLDCKFCIIINDINQLDKLIKNISNKTQIDIKKQNNIIFNINYVKYFNLFNYIIKNWI